jgi:hypothetical protein
MSSKGWTVKEKGVALSVLQLRGPLPAKPVKDDRVVYNIAIFF